MNCAPYVIGSYRSRANRLSHKLRQIFDQSMKALCLKKYFLSADRHGAARALAHAHLPRIFSCLGKRSDWLALKFGGGGGGGVRTRTKAIPVKYA